MGGNAASIFQTPYEMASPGHQIMQLLPTANMTRPMGGFGMQMPNYSTNIGLSMLNSFPLSMAATGYPHQSDKDESFGPSDNSIRRLI